MISDCKLEGDHFMADLSAVGGGYLTVAAVLAGFAFSGLILLLTVRMFPDAAVRLPSSYPAAVRALLAAFISLAVGATDYAYLSGLEGNPGPAASHSVLYGQAFAIAAMQLVYATLLVVATAEAAGAKEAPSRSVFGTFQKVVVGALAPFIVLSLFAGVTEYKQLHPGGEGVLDLILGSTCVIVALFAIVWFISRAWRRSAAAAERVPAMAGGATAVVALMTLLTFTGSFNPHDSCSTGDLWVLVLASVVTGVALIVLVCAVAMFRVPDAAAPNG
jgi:hypothetical protein